MKLYLWSRVTTLARYSDGKALALADTKERAIELIVDSYLSYLKDIYYYSEDDMDDTITPKIEDLNKELNMTEPEEITNEYGCLIFGSE